MRSLRPAERIANLRRAAALRLRGERGSVTAEFAVVVPAVLVVLGLSVGAVMLAAHRLTLGSAAAEVARLEARGDLAAADARVVALGSGVGVARSRAGPLLCITLTARPGSGALGLISLTADGCAAVSGAGA